MARCSRANLGMATITATAFGRSQAHAYIFEHIELPAKLLDYFLRSNKSNIKQYTGQFVSGKAHVAGYVYYADDNEYLPMFQQIAWHGIGGSISQNQLTRSC